MKRWLSVLALVVLAGCGSGNSNSNNSNNNPIIPTTTALVGTWGVKSIATSSGSQTITCPGAIPSASGGSGASCGSQDSLTLNADNTFTSTATSDSGVVTHPAGTWSLSGSDFRLTQSSGNAGTTSVLTINGSTDGRTFTLNNSYYITTFSK